MRKSLATIIDHLKKLLNKEKIRVLGKFSGGPMSKKLQKYRVIERPSPPPKPRYFRILWRACNLKSSGGYLSGTGILLLAMSHYIGEPDVIDHCGLVPNRH
jgi:hypothetical protein